MNELVEVTRQCIQLFESKQIPYAVMGGLAVRAYALPRPTYDIDFAVILSRNELAGFYAAAEECGFAIPPVYETGWVDSVRELPLVKVRAQFPGHSIDIDIFLAETPFLREAMSRRRFFESVDVTGWFVSLEDLVLLKALSSRPRDRIDIGDILLVSGDLDMDYVNRWATELDITKELQAAFREFEERG